MSETPAPATNDYYLVIIRSERFLLVGPFPTHRAAADWGNEHGYGPDDDPRWQTIRLADPSAPVEIVAPVPGCVP